MFDSTNGHSPTTTLPFDDDVLLEEMDLLVELIIAATLSADRLTPSRIDEVFLWQGAWR